MNDGTICWRWKRLGKEWFGEFWTHKGFWMYRRRYVRKAAGHISLGLQGESSFGVGDKNLQSLFKAVCLDEITLKRSVGIVEKKP